MSTIYILWLRQVKRYFRAKSRIIGSLGQPLLFLVAFGFGFGPIFQKAGQGNYLEFITPGIISMSILFTAIFSGIEIIWDKQFGFLKETLVAPVSRINIMIGRTIGGATVAVFQGLVVLVLSTIIGFRPHDLTLLPVAFVFMFLIALLFASLGTIIGSLLDDMQGFQLIINFLVMPLFFLSGALFPLKNLPAVFAVIAAADPLSYGIDGLRFSFGSPAHFGAGIDFIVLLVLCIILLLIGSRFFSKIQI
ncbi:MAG TPA: ABC transporter permease [Patescibacteria group bacterium]|nr:ABC transporter permease [Patescibacteria group bacterium]